MQVLRVSSDLSHASLKIELARRHNGEIVARAQASGFLWDRLDRTWLITNVHNLSGWDYTRGRAMSDLGFTPTELQIHLAVKRKIDAKHYEMTRSIVGAQLDAADGNPIWLVHPSYGEMVDVAAISLGKIDIKQLWPNADTSGAELGNSSINRLGMFTDFDVNAGDDAFVIGYPLTLEGGEGFPIWKRASIASEPAADVNDLPRILVDTATRKGMSGSPVIVKRSGLIPKRTGQPGDQLIGTAATFLGIYSGRVDDDPMGAQLGIVWKGAVIDQIIDGGRRGRLPWNPN